MGHVHPRTARPPGEPSIFPVMLVMIVTRCSLLLARTTYTQVRLADGFTDSVCVHILKNVRATAYFDADGAASCGPKEGTASFRYVQRSLATACKLSMVNIDDGVWMQKKQSSGFWAGSSMSACCFLFFFYGSITFWRLARQGRRVAQLSNNK